MNLSWDTYSRQGIDLAATATNLGFSAVKTGTKLGFAVTRGIAVTVAGLTTTIVDHTLFGGSNITSLVVSGAVSSVISLAEQITMAPIFLSEYITHASLMAAHSSINVLSTIFPGSSEASFSLASFITLVKREWNDSEADMHLPGKRYGLAQVGRAIVAWALLQHATQEWQEKKWFKFLREIDVKDAPIQAELPRARRSSRVRVTSDVIFPGNKGQIIAADIGEAPLTRTHSSNFHSRGSLRRKHSTVAVQPSRLSNTEMKATLRRLSKMVLAGYGGASLLFFGVSPTSASVRKQSSQNFASSEEKASEEVQLAKAIDASEAEAAGDALDAPTVDAYSWWDVLLGKHDQEIFERFANSPPEQAQAEINAQMRATAVIGVEHQMPRFWVLTDHGRGQIVLVLRGTMSLNEIAVDLTCDAEDFEPATTSDSSAENEEQLPPGKFYFPTVPPTGTRVRTDTMTSVTSTLPRHHMHSGMLRMARAMGDVGKPVQLAVHEALYHNPDYELVMCGHSLGAGVAAALGLMWADPKTCLTVQSSGLPVGRKVSVYCFAPPCLVDAALSAIASRLIVSFVYSHDVVSRLSLGSVRDLKNAAMWLCDANGARGDKKGEGYIGVTARTRQWKAGLGSTDDPDWFIAVRKTLEANMQMADMYPPGRVLWAMRDSDLLPSHRLPTIDKQGSGADKLRLFEVLDVEKIFSQIVFAKDMLSAHLPHQYDRVLHDLL